MRSNVPSDPSVPSDAADGGPASHTTAHASSGGALADDGAGDVSLFLAGLTAPVTAASFASQRRVPAMPPLGRLTGVLFEIDATVMARQIILRAGDGAVVRLEVSNRRVLGYSAERSGETHGVGVPRMLTYAGVDDLSRFKDDIDDICRNELVTVSSAPPSGTLGVEHSGVSVATLRNLWDVSARTGDAARTSSVSSASIPHALGRAELDDFASHWERQVPALHMSTGRAAGAPDDVDALSQRLNDWMGTHPSPASLTSPSSPVEDGPIAEILSHAHASSHSLFFARDRGTALAMYVPSDRVNDVAAGWIRHIRPADR